MEELEINEASQVDEYLVRVRAGVTLEGNLAVPERARGVVLFAHGSGSSRHSFRNRYVARVLQGAGLATLLIDLLTPDEEAADVWQGRLRFDVRLLARRLVGATDWLKQNGDTRELPLGDFGADTGAGAAMMAAVECSDVVGAIVSRGGGLDLAGAALPRVRAAMLLIVGGLDYPVLAINKDALDKLGRGKEFIVIPGATHLFAEPGALEEVARLATKWFLNHLVRR